MIATSAGNPRLLGIRRCRRIVEASVPSAHRRATSNTKQRLTASGPPEHIVKHCLSALRTPADQYPPIELDFIDCRLGVSQVPNWLSASGFTRSQGFKGCLPETVVRCGGGWRRQQANLRPNEGLARRSSITKIAFNWRSISFARYLEQRETELGS